MAGNTVWRSGGNSDGIDVGVFRTRVVREAQDRFNHVGRKSIG